MNVLRTGRGRTAVALTVAGVVATWVQLTRGEADRLELRLGSPVWLRAARHASALVGRPGGG